MFHNVGIFLFGTRGEFNELCHDVVTRLKKQFPYIKRKVYLCLYETAVLQKDKKEQEDKTSQIIGKKIKFREYDEIKQTKFYGKFAYINRNKYVINEADYCLFYYRENYEPDYQELCHGKRMYRSNSGTKIMYEYALKNKKHIIIV